MRTARHLATTRTLGTTSGVLLVMALVIVNSLTTRNYKACAGVCDGSAVIIAVSVNQHTEVTTDQSTMTVVSNIPLVVTYTDTSGVEHSASINSGISTITNVRNYELVTTQ